MIITIDSNEYALHPKIVESLNYILMKKQQTILNREKEGSVLYNLYKENKIISKKLLCGDYMCNNVLAEHKVLPDYCSSVMSGHLMQQCQDMLYTKEQNPDMKLYILISGNPEDIPRIEHAPSIDAMVAAWASLNMRIPTSFLGNTYFFCKGLVDLFEKHFDGKIREYNPIRKPQEFDDIILSNYCSLVGEVTAKNLLKKFPYPKLLYNATKEQLMEVEGVGKDTAEFIVNVFEGREKSWKALEEKKKEIKEQKKIKKEQKKSKIESTEPIDLSIPKSI